MGQYRRMRCPVCYCSIETDVVVDYCPACKAYIKDQLNASGDGTGINTATARGPGLRPLTDLEQDVY